MDDIGLHPAFSEPARQPEAVTPGLIGNDNALKRPTRFCGLVPPTLQKPEQRVPLRLKFLQLLAVNPGHDPGHKPACLAHLDHHNQGAILLEGSEGSAQVVRLWHGGTSSVLSSDDRASPLAAPHSIYSDLAITMSSGAARASTYRTGVSPTFAVLCGRSAGMYRKSPSPTSTHSSSFSPK